jgi:Ca2+/H+ antiporter
MIQRQEQPHEGREEPKHWTWSRLLQRSVLENVATVLIVAGVLMLLQPFSLALYGYSFVVTLVGIVMFTIVTKFPE